MQLIWCRSDFGRCYSVSGPKFGAWEFGNRQAQTSPQAKSLETIGLVVRGAPAPWQCNNCEVCLCEDNLAHAVHAVFWRAYIGSGGVLARQLLASHVVRVRIESRKELSIPIFANWAATSVQVAKHSLTILVGCEFGKSCPCRSLVQVIQTCHCPVMQIETYIGITKSSWDPEGRGRK